MILLIYNPEINKELTSKTKKMGIKKNSGNYKGKKKLESPPLNQRITTQNVECGEI